MSYALRKWVRARDILYTVYSENESEPDKRAMPSEMSQSQIYCMSYGLRKWVRAREMSYVYSEKLSQSQRDEHCTQKLSQSKADSESIR